MIRIALYGKGGIGKSTVASNLSCALADRGLRVMQIGCDPKSDSTLSVMGGARIPTVLDTMRAGGPVALEDVVFRGYRDVACVEAGGPTPGVGCAGRGIIAAFDKLAELDAFAQIDPDVILYDVLGDVVCGGFAMPIRNGHADYVFVVTSGEMMSLYAAGNIIEAVKQFGKRKYASLGGLILNRRGIEREGEKIDEFAREAGCAIVGDIARNPIVQTAEASGRTVIELFPESDYAETIRSLAQTMLETCTQ